MKIEKVGVVGCGLMGSGIAQVAAGAGLTTVVVEVDEARLREGMGRIDSFLEKGVARGKLTPEQKQDVLSRIEATTSLEKLSDVDVVIEAVLEELAVKKELFGKLDAILRPEAIRCSNTSSLCITEMAAGTRHPERFVGLHFFNPVPLMKVVEIIPGLSTEPKAAEAVFGLARRLGKTPIAAPDRPGFIVNRLLVPYLLDAVRALEEGVGTKEDIDAGMKLGCGYPMGPLELLDFVGLDTTYYIANIMFDEFREKRFAPPPLLRRMVLAGRLGRKSGKGFYEYT
ncbi:MAG TPA: 3-hydroxybutyryl-CoA dehydrogenase [Vicinamibacteria bacterium]|nr:3-hydroxybutyryl-CoA dehydrogenase [Vicinamibacteria bacterium]